MNTNDTTKNTDIRILIVDDHALTRLGLRVALEEQPGWTVVGEAADAESALQKFEELQPSIILLDIGLPKVDGIECLGRLKATGRPCRVMIRSSHEESNAIILALAAGADGYCLKDSNDSILFEGIRCLSRDKAWLDPRIAASLLVFLSAGVKERAFGSSTLTVRIELKPEEVSLLNQIACHSSAPIATPESNAGGGIDSSQLRNLFGRIGAMKSAD